MDHSSQHMKKWGTGGSLILTFWCFLTHLCITHKVHTSNLYERRGNGQMKHHKTCFYFKKEPCLDFYVLGGPHIPKIFHCWVHPMAISDLGFRV
jgi:hypothetical protein